MRFRPCIDLHHGVVKQIVGSTLKDQVPENGTCESEKHVQVAQQPVENFASKLPSKEYASMYKRDKLFGGHIIMLGPGNEEAALEALREYPGGLQVGGGVTPLNAKKYLDAGASHVIVTSYVFKNGKIHLDRLEALAKEVGANRLVLDLSCRKKSAAQQQFALQSNDDPADQEANTNLISEYFVVTDRWQKFTDFRITEANLQLLSKYCSEFLVHGVDVEGKQCGIMEDLVECLGKWSPIPCTYAGGIRNRADVELVGKLGRGRIDYTIGSALDIFGGSLAYKDIVGFDQEQAKISSMTVYKNVSNNNQVNMRMQRRGIACILFTVSIFTMYLIHQSKNRKDINQRP